jgi:hypothetical protein
LSQGGRRDRIVVATKVYQPMETGPNDRRLSAYHIRRACEASLRRLKTDYVDLYQMHHIDPATPWEEIWQAMEQLIREGKITYVGSSNFAGRDRLHHHLGHRLVCLEMCGFEVRFVGRRDLVNFEHDDVRGIVPIGNRLQHKDSRLGADGGLDLFSDCGPVVFELRRIDFDMSDLHILSVCLLRKRASREMCRQH